MLPHRHQHRSRRFTESAAALLALLSLACCPAHAQSARPEAVSFSPSRWLFPPHFLRGYTEFDVAPPHNEPDLGRCNQPQPNCTAFARYILGGYVEFQPFGRSLLRHFYFFYEPRFFFGSNIPQVQYTASFQPLAMERSLGLGVELPKHFELRVTNHSVISFDPFDRILGPADSGPNKEPLGLYTTVGVRWYFGGLTRERGDW